MNRRQAARLIAAALPAALIAPRFAAHAAPAPQAARAGSAVRFSFMLWALARQVPFDRCLDIVAEAGYQGVELVGEFQKWSPGERTRILARLHSLNLVVDSMSGVHAAFAVPADSPTFHTQFAEHLDYAQALNCPQVILLSGKRVDGLAPHAQRDTSIENLKRAADTAAKRSIEIVIEPIDYLENPTIFMASVDQAFEIATAVDAPNLKVLYDLYHEQRSFGNLIEKLEKNIAQVGLIHVADVPGRHEPGTGEIDYPTIYTRLAALHYTRWIAMEFYPTTEPVACLRKARQEVQTALQSTH